MANVKITELSALTNPVSTDVLPIVDVAADATKKVTIADLLENAGDGSTSAPAFSFDTDPDTGMYRTGANGLGFVTGGTEAGRFDSSGRLLIGTGVSPSSGDSIAQNAPLLIQGRVGSDTDSGRINLQRGSAASADESIGTISFTDSSNNAYARIAVEADAATGTNDYPGRIKFQTTLNGESTPATRLTIKNDGNIIAPQIYASTTASAANVNVNSDGYLIRSISSLKFKKDIETIENTYSDALLNCRPVWFRSKSDYDNPDWGYWGFIAEEVAEIDPRLVSWKTTEITYDEEGSEVRTACDPEPEGVQYDRFVPHLLNLIKGQQQTIAALEQRLTDAGL